MIIPVSVTSSAQPGRGRFSDMLLDAARADPAASWGGLEYTPAPSPSYARTPPPLGRRARGRGSPAFSAASLSLALRGASPPVPLGVAPGAAKLAEAAQRQWDGPRGIRCGHSFVLRVLCALSAATARGSDQSRSIGRLCQGDAAAWRRLVQVVGAPLVGEAREPGEADRAGASRVASLAHPTVLRR